MLSELTAATVRPLLVGFEGSWLSGKVPRDWKKENVNSKKGKEEDSGNCKLLASPQSLSR